MEKQLAFLKENADYDRIYVDTPPALNFYAVSALIACDRVLIPFDCDSFSRQALYGLLSEIADLREDHNEDLLIEGIVVNQFQARASLPQQRLDELIAEGLPVLPVYLTINIDRDKAARFGLNVGDVQDTIAVAVGGRQAGTL